jgi:4-amino-4-deoxy-L-arabinose transferase-like glycosyltransferase
MSRTRIALVVIFLAALGVRLAYLDSNPHPRYGGWLEGDMAHNIVADGHWFQVNDYRFNPVPLSYVPRLIEPADLNLRYADAHPVWKPEIVEPVGEAVVLAGLWEITGSERFLPDELLRIVLDALTALLIYRIVMELFGRQRAALLAAAFYAVYPPIAWQTTSPYMDIWAVDMTVAILALQLQAVRSPNHWRWLIACGLVVGVLNISAGRRAAFVRAVATTAVALVLVIPWTIRNYNDFHMLIPFRSGTGQTLWEGLGELPNNFGATFGGLGTTETERMVHRERPGLVVESPAWDNFLLHKATQAIEQHPLFFARLLLYRTAQATVWSSYAFWMHRGAVAPWEYKAGLLAYLVERPFNVLEDMLEPAVFLLGMLSLGLTWRHWRKAHIVLLTVVLATIVPYIPLLIEHRYILPAAFAYLIWIALGADLLIERWRTGGKRAASVVA